MAGVGVRRWRAIALVDGGGAAGAVLRGCGAVVQRGRCCGAAVAVRGGTGDDAIALADGCYQEV